MATQEPTPFTSEYSRDLTPFQVTVTGLGMMLGAGVFFGITNSWRLAGSGGMLLTFALGGVVALLTAMAFAELGSALPRGAGTFAFAAGGFGRFGAFLAGWMEWFAVCMAAALYAVLLAGYVVSLLVRFRLLGWLPWDLADPANSSAFLLCRRAVAAVVLVFFLFVNGRGSGKTARIAFLCTFFQMMLLLVIVAAAAVVTVVEPQRLRHFQPALADGWSPLLSSMGVVFVAFVGFTAIAQAGDEAVHPRRTLPRSMRRAVLVAVVFYLLVGFAAVVLVRPEAPALSAEGHLAPLWLWIGQFHATEVGRVVELLMSRAGGIVAAAAALLAAVAAFHVTMVSATRSAYVLARHRMLPAGLTAVSGRRKRPWRVIAISGLLMVGFTGIPHVADLAAAASLMFLFLCVLAVLCVLRFRRRHPARPSAYRMPLFPLLPLLTLPALLALVYGVVRESAAACALAPTWVAAGVLIYLVYGRRYGEAADAGIADAPAKAADERTHVLVSVANPENAVEMVRNAYNISDADNTRVELLHMVRVPAAPLPLDDAAALTAGARGRVVESLLYLTPHFPVDVTLRYGRSIANGIISAVREKAADTLILGWHGRPRSRAVSLGRTLDSVIDQVQCNVLVFKNCGGNRVFRRILVPMAGGPNGPYALEIATRLAEPHLGEVVPFTVQRGRREFDIDGFIDAHAARLHIPRERVRPKGVHSRYVVPVVLREAAHYDLVVLGCTAGPVSFKWLRRPVPEMVARLCPTPLVMVKAAAAAPSLLERPI